MRVRWWAGIVVALVLSLPAAALSAGDGEPSRDPFEAMSVHRAAEAVAAPAVVFRTVEGREVGLADLRGQVVLLGFFTTT